MSDAIEVSDRYDALGIPHPDTRTMCKGMCEGTGWIPIYMAEGDHRAVAPNMIVQQDEGDEVLRVAWRKAEAAHATDDGWHFVPCPRCKGTGKR